MFVYLSKRIAIPNGTTITSIAWHEGEGWLACGGSGGLLKVLKVDGGQRSGGLSLNQTLERHTSTVQLVNWNEACRRLTSSDDTGQIVVWSLHKGMWFEGMVNNRNKSSVVDLCWSVGGKRICIAYADGVVTVGGVEGNRIWSRNMEGELVKCCWSPDDQYLVFATADGAVYVHEAGEGDPVSRVTIHCLDASEPNEAPDEGAAAAAPAAVPRIASLVWCPYWVDRPEPLAMLTICYEHGPVQLMRNTGDDAPIIFNSGLTHAQQAAWNPQGTILAICGVVQGSGADNSSVAVNLFNQQGSLQRTLRILGKHCGGLTWEGDGLRMAIAVDSSVYFANVRPQYKYAFLHTTLVYSFNRPDKVDDSICFWNTRNNDRCIRYVSGLKYIGASQGVCLGVSQWESPGTRRGATGAMVRLLNSIGCPITTRFIDIDPVACDISSSYAVVCGDENIYLWQFRDPSLKLDAVDPVSMQVSRGSSLERIFHVDDLVRATTSPTMKIRSAVTNDLITTVALSSEYIIVSRESGILHIYHVHPLQLKGKLVLSPRPNHMAINANSTTLAVIDLGGVLQLYPLEPDTWELIPHKAAPIPGFEHKDVWCMRWAEDDSKCIAFMEKTRLYIHNGETTEEPVHSTANLCQFKSQRVRGVQFDELFCDPEKPRRESINEYETSRLREIRDMLTNGRMTEAYNSIYANPNPKLWRMLAEESLGQLNFPMAEMAVIAAKDYPALQFIKRIKLLDDPRKQLAEIESFHRHFEESEKIFKSLDRKDLALKMREHLGDWFGVVRLVQEGGGDESLKTKAWECIGDNYAETNKWNKAAQYYAQSGQYRKLAKAYYLMENYDMLMQLITLVEHDRELQLELGEMLLSVGHAVEAAKAYLLAGEPRLAMEGCIAVNLWSNALALMEEHHLNDIRDMLQRVARRLIRSEKLAEAIELYQMAGDHDESAMLLLQLGSRAGTTDPLRAKKFYVLAALEVEKYRRKKLGLNKEGADVVDAMLSEDYRPAAADHLLDSAWKGAEAFHFFLMCQYHLRYRNIPAATVIAVRLMAFDDIIPPVDSYCLIALASYLSGNFGLCSKAFTRLEAGERMDEAAARGGGAVGGQLDALMGLGELDCTANNGAASVIGSMMRMTASFSGGAGVTYSGAAGGATMLSGMTLELTNPSKGSGAAAASALTYPTVPIEDRPSRFADLAVKIFTKHPPEDNSVDSVACPNCSAYNKEWASACVKCGESFGACLVSGKAIPDLSEAWQCPVCRHYALENEIERWANCPLCHTPIKHRIRRSGGPKDDDYDEEDDED